jgi:putative transposase
LEVTASNLRRHELFVSIENLRFQEKEEIALGVDKELIDRLLAEYKSPEEIVGLLKQLTKAIVERAFEAELTTYLRYDKPSLEGQDNRRKGRKSKGPKAGTVEIEGPRDRQPGFEPNLLLKGERRFAGFDNRILSLYGHGLTRREIQGHLEEMYEAEVSPALISNVTDALIEQVKAWLSRPLDALYPVVYLDVLKVKIREQGRVESRAVYTATGITLGGKMEVLGLWTSAMEGAEFWVQVLTELQNRGVKDIFIVCVDDLKGFPTAIERVYPKTSVQLCIVHMVRASLNYVSWKERRLVAQDLKLIYRAASLEEAERQLADFAQQWDKRYPSISALWRRNWSGVIPLFQFPAEIRKIIYTTNAIESLNLRLRKAIRTRVAFLSEEAVLKVMYLASRNLAKKWTAVHGWKYALNCFSVLWEARFPQNGL